MNHKRIKKEIAKLEKVFALPPPIRLLMEDGRIEEIPMPDQDILGFVLGLLHKPLSREVALICQAVTILDQPGHMVELVAVLIDHPKRVLTAQFTPEVVERKLCTREQYCGLEPQSREEVRMRIKEVYEEK